MTRATFLHLIGIVIVLFALMGIILAMLAVAGTHPELVVVLAIVGMVLLGYAGGGLK